MSIQPRAIVSMIPGDATHIIDKINASNCKIDDIFNWFTSISQLAPKKVFFIKKINDDLSDIIIQTDRYEDTLRCKVCYKYKDGKYKCKFFHKGEKLENIPELETKFEGKFAKRQHQRLLKDNKIKISK